MRRTYMLRVTAVFVVLFIVYLLIARFVLEPLGYYGTVEKPRFADPWIARAETILGGGQLYRDVFTAAPPLVNFLMIPPTVISGLFEHRNPWSTLSFMSYFSLFNLFIAYVLLFTDQDAREGYRSALYFLLNPLTFGNSVLRRQDEPILVFFFSLSLLFMARQHHWKACIAMGLAMLVKLSGALMIPVAFARTRDWKYLVIPIVIFGMVFAPFIVAGGETAVSNIAQKGTQHPFRFRGISLGALWSAMHGEATRTGLIVYSTVMVVGVALILILIARKPLGLFEDMSLLTAVVLMLAPNLHCGYLLILVLMMTPLLHKYRMEGFYFLFGLLALVADMYKWPVENFEIAFGLVLATFGVIALAMVRLRWPRKATGAALAS
jgi:Gpi18-like mannosyltransferase